jgi:hypothetical protein
MRDGGEHDFGVAMPSPRRRRAGAREFVLQFAVVINFAVEYDDLASAGRMHRLRAVFGQIDDRQAAVTERAAGGGIHPPALFVRAAMGECFRHARDRGQHVFSGRRGARG